jgi:hypothetical protein
MLGVRQHNLALAEVAVEAAPGEFVWRIGRASRLLSQLAQHGGRGAVGSEVFELGGGRWTLRLVLLGGSASAGDDVCRSLHGNLECLHPLYMVTVEQRQLCPIHTWIYS